MIDFRFILFSILFVNILQLPQAQKVMAWSWAGMKFNSRKSGRWIKKWARRLYYFLKGVVNG